MFEVGKVAIVLYMQKLTIQSLIRGDKLVLELPRLVPFVVVAY